MKVIQISAVYNKGSVGKIVKSIHSYLLEQNVESYVLYGVGKDVIDKTKEIKTTPKFERYFSHIYYLLTGINFTGCFFGTKKIIHTIKRIEPDAVHIHCYNDYYMNIYMLLRWLNKHNQKVVVTQHAEHYYTGSCGHALSCNKWKENGCDGKCHFFSEHKKGYPLFDKTKSMWKKMKKSFASFNKDNLTIVSCTPWLDKRMKESIILKGIKNHCVIYNGADEKMYKPYSAVSKETIILYVTSRFDDEIKGSRYINEVAKTFINDKDIKIHIVGNVPDDYKLEKNVVKLGPLYGEELAKEYSKAMVTIMLSKAECFPMVIVESLLCGTKVVAFKCGGPDEAYGEDLVSFVEWGNFLSVYWAIKAIVEANYNKNNIANTARKNYTNIIMANKYYNLYKSL